MKKYTTTRKGVGDSVRIAGTGFKIVVPHSAKAYAGLCEFSLGSITFHVNGYGKNRIAHPMTPIPQSWFVDLNAVNGD